ncbi:MAG: cellulase family glycosylhydrolase [Rhodoferax sp.]
MRVQTITRHRLTFIWIWFVASVGLALMCVCKSALAGYVVSADEKTGLPTVSKGGVVATGSNFAFWGSDWAWAGLSSEFKVVQPYLYSFVGRSKLLDVDVSANIHRKSDQELIWSFQLDANSELRNVVGGGMVFKFDLANFSADLGEPSLLPSNRGWTWGRDGKSRMEMRFDPPLASVYFELGKKNELRAFFYSGSIPRGKTHYSAKLTLYGDMATGPTSDERFGLVDKSVWPLDNLDWKTAPVDLSFMNATEIPAGKHGFVKVDSNRLQFADGSNARFWGTNVAAYSLFGTSKDVVRQQAKRLSALGFNLVRLHHHDSPWVNPNIFGNSKTVRDTERLDAESLDRLDWWIKCLKDEGIYVWLDLHVQRMFKAGDNIFGFDEIRKGKEVADLKGYSYVNPSIQDAMKRFNAAYVTHTNSYTGLAYKDEPAIAAMLITNENDITHHFGNALLPDKQVPEHNRLYTAEADKFAHTYALPSDKVWRSWEHGPSKLFLNDLERRFNVEMLAQLRELGVRVPIATTSSWGNSPLSALPALTAGDIVDVHAYGGEGQLGINPLIGANMTHWMSAGHVVDKPMTVTEWNAEPFPTPDRHTLPLFIAATASHQGWSGLMQYAYMQEPIRGAGTASNWQASNDPALLATMPAAALMYRQGHVQEATTTYIFDPGADMLFNKVISPATSPALRTAAERGKLMIAMPQTKELPWLSKSILPKDAIVLRDPAIAVFDVNATEIASDTGEIVHNWANSTYTINTARTQAAMGWLGGRSISLTNVAIKSSTHNATIAVQSLDGLPIATSGNLLISLGTRAVPKSNSQVPYLVEPLEAELLIRAAKGLKLTKRDAQQQVQDVPTTYRDGVYSIKLDNTIRTNWLFLRGSQWGKGQ